MNAKNNSTACLTTAPYHDIHPRIETKTSHCQRTNHTFYGRAKQYEVDRKYEDCPQVVQSRSRKASQQSNHYPVTNAH